MSCPTCGYEHESGIECAEYLARVLARKEAELVVLELSVKQQQLARSLGGKKKEAAHA